MKRFRPVVLLVLLLTVPFQAAVGASGLLCAAVTHHGQAVQMAAHDHAGVPTADHHHPADMAAGDHHASTASGHHGAPQQAETGDASDTSGKCKICNELCSAVTPVPAVAPSLFPPDTPLRVSTLVDPEWVSRSGDGLFRPPRTTSVPVAG